MVEKKKKKDRAPPPEPVQQMEVDDNNEDQESDEEEEFPVPEGGINIQTRDGKIYIPPAPPAVCSLDSTGPRLIITHIENENFKSYAGIRVLGPFHKSFTSIIGPNGSGKSNVIDSMLFVFGYRASKIRSKKISVLLHKSENHRDIRSCTVAVNFARIIDIDEDNFEYVPNSKFKIARTAFADNSSFYSIDGKRAHFKQVSSLLLEQGIDLIHNRFLILQGEVEQIAMMKPKAPSEHECGMLEYLEDIVGTSRYKVPIEQLSKEVELFNDERAEKKNRLIMAEKEKDALEGPMGEAVGYLEGCNQLTLLKNKAYQAEQYEYQQQIEQQEKEKQDKDNGMTELKTKLKGLSAQLEEYKNDIQKSETDHNAVHNERETKSEAYRQMEAQDAAYTEEMKQVNNKRKKVKEQLKQEQKKLDDAEALPEKNAKEIMELQVVLERLNKQRAKEQEEVTNTLAGLREETQELQENKERLQTTLAGLKTTVDEARQKHDLKESELNIYLSNEQKEKAKLDQLKATLTKTSDKLKERRTTLAELDEKLPRARNKLQEAQEELIELRREEATAAQELQRRRVSLDERRVAMNSNRSRGRVLDFLMTQKQEGTIPGIFGRLGDLGGIDGKYDVAVSTACGPLDNIVVDCVRTGEACVAALKRHNVGRATFICLEKQENLRNYYTRPFQAPENVPRLFDLIQVTDDRVRPAFYYALRDTLVTNNLDQATRIAYGRTRYRVVTLKGELIEMHGTMSGGGNSMSRGRMGRAAAAVVDASPGEMGRMEQGVGELERRVQAVRARITQLETTVETLTRDVRLWSTDVNKFRVEVDGLSSQEPVLHQQVKTQESRVREVAPDQDTVNEMRAAVDAAKKDLGKAEKEAGKVEVEVQAVTDEIQQITGNRTNTAQKKLRDVVKKADKISSEITKLGVAIKTAERTTKKSSEAVKNMEADIKQAEDRLMKLKDEKDKIMQEAKELVTEIEALSKKELEFQEILEKKKTRVSEIAKEENELKASKFKEDQILKAISTKIHELKSRISQKENQLKKLQMKKIPNKEVEMELRVFNDEELAEIELKKIDYKIATLEEQLKKETPNLKVIDDYYAKLKQCEQRLKDVDEVTARRNEMRQWHENVRKSRLAEFMAGFSIITDKLKEMYQMITLGGDAELELVDSLDPFTEGIVFSVRPPKKSWKHISNLSGGEKTLSSLALVFALHYYKPTPLYVMDEIDAALDFKNVSIVGHYIKERTKNAQFIIISLRANMFELADTLVGIFKVHNCTDSATLTPGTYAGPCAHQNGVAFMEEQARIAEVAREAEQASDVARKLADRAKLLNEPSTSQSPPRKVARRLTDQ